MADNKLAQITAFKGMLNAESVQAQFKNALGKHSDTFTASMVELYSSDPALAKCAPQLVIKECLKAATLQLPINKALGFSYVVVYNNNVKDEKTGQWVSTPTPTFITGYKGLIQLAMRTGQYRTINADVVFEGEMRKGNKLTGEIFLDGEKTSDKIVGYFAHFELLNGFSKTLFMTVEEMASYAKKYSPSVGRNVTVDELIKKANANGAERKMVGWMGNFTDMALKTCMRRLLGKYGYLSVEMQGAMAEEASAEDSAMDNRDKLQQGAATQVVNFDEAEVVDEQTAEVVEPEQPKQAPQAQQQARPAF